MSSSFFSFLCRRSVGCLRRHGLDDRWRRVFVAMAGFVWIASARTAPPPPPTEPTVSVEFTIVGWGEEIEGLGYRQEGKLVPIVAPEYERSASYTYAGPRKMELHRLPAGAPDPANRIQGSVTPPPPAVATVTFDPAVRRATVLLAPSAKGYESFVIPDDAASSPPGMAVLLNLARSRIAVRCNKTETVVLAPRAHRLVGPGPQGVLDAAVAQEKAGAWQRVKRSYTPVRANQQVVIVFFQAQSGEMSRVTLRQTYAPIELAQNMTRR